MGWVVVAPVETPSDKVEENTNKHGDNQEFWVLRKGSITRSRRAHWLAGWLAVRYQGDSR